MRVPLFRNLLQAPLPPDSRTRVRATRPRGGVANGCARRRSVCGFFALALLAPLLAVPALPGRDPDGRWVAWAKERPDGGRGFGTTCGHFYENWRNDDFRKLMLNVIAWSARVNVPAEGMESAFVERDEILKALAPAQP